MSPEEKSWAGEKSWARLNENRLSAAVTYYGAELLHNERTDEQHGELIEYGFQIGADRYMQAYPKSCPAMREQIAYDLLTVLECVAHGKTGEEHGARRIQLLERMRDEMAAVAPPL